MSWKYGLALAGIGLQQQQQQQRAVWRASGCDKETGPRNLMSPNRRAGRHSKATRFGPMPNTPNPPPHTHTLPTHPPLPHTPEGEAKERRAAQVQCNHKASYEGLLVERRRFAFTMTCRSKTQNPTALITCTCPCCTAL